MQAKFDYSTITRVQQANDIVDVVSEHLNLTKKGREMVGLCPFHEDHRPSLYVNPTKQIFKCFACGAGGDVLKFIQMRENLSFTQALDRLAQRAGIEIKQRRSAPRTDKDGLAPDKLARINDWAAKFFAQKLAADTAARKYLRDRSILPESEKSWQLGLAPDSYDTLLKAATKLGLSRKALLHAGLVTTGRDSSASYDKFRNRLIFPIHDVTGRIIGFGGRTLDDNSGPKYLNSPATALFDKSKTLYGLYHARHHIGSADTVVVVEGYTDCIMAHQHNCRNVVATLGTSLTDHHARILRRYANKIVLVFDSDTAGVEAANRALEIGLARRLDIRIVCLPHQKDPCDFILANGKDAFQNLIENAADVMQFKYNRLLEQFNAGATLADQKAATEQYLTAVAAALLAGNLDPLDKGLVVNKLAAILPLSAHDINHHLATAFRKLKRASSQSSPSAQTAPDLGTGYYARAQQEIIEILLAKPDLFKRLKQFVSPADFDVPIFAEIATALFEYLETAPDLDLAALTARIESTAASGLILRLADDSQKKQNFQPRLKDALHAIDRYKRKKTLIKQLNADDALRLKTELARPDRRNLGMLPMQP